MGHGIRRHEFGVARGPAQPNRVCYNKNTMTEKKEHVITVYTSPGCGFCHMATDYLDEHKLKYQTKDIAEDPEAMEFILNNVGQAVAPVITIDDEVIVGFDRPKIAKTLNLV